MRHPCLTLPKPTCKDTSDKHAQYTRSNKKLKKNTNKQKKKKVESEAETG